MTQPEPNWSGAVQRELDGIQRSIDARFSAMQSTVDKLLTLNEYNADKRVSEIQLQGITDKLDDTESDLLRVHSELKEGLTALRHEFLEAIKTEKDERQKTFKEFLDAKKSQFRWLVSMVMIPIGIGLVDLLVPKKH